MSYTNRELINNALKRVNALLGIDGKLYKDNTGWFIVDKGLVIKESSMSASEMLAYLHGIEDGVVFINNQKK